MTATITNQRKEPAQRAPGRRMRCFRRANTAASAASAQPRPTAVSPDWRRAASWLTLQLMTIGACPPPPALPALPPVALPAVPLPVPPLPAALPLLPAAPEVAVPPAAPTAPLLPAAPAPPSATIAPIKREAMRRVRELSPYL